MSLIGTLAGEYGWSLEYILDLPLAQAFALFTVAAIRNGKPPAGPNYETQDMLRAIERARADAPQP